MLPYTPLHHLLLAPVGRPLVCTSGNLSEEPMAIDTADAVTRLGRIADLLLTHNRPIVRPVDDSVARVGPDGLQMLRRRGYAPLPIRLGGAGPTILAVGGHLKNTVALRLGPDVVLSPHIGDLDNTLSVDVHARAVDDLLSSLRPSRTWWPATCIRTMPRRGIAERLAAALGRAAGPRPAPSRPRGRVRGGTWIGRAGAGPVLGRNRLRHRRDGVGRRGAACARAANSRRVAHLRTFPLPGGDRAAREPRRAALGLLFEMLGRAVRGRGVGPGSRPQELADAAGGSGTAAAVPANQQPGPAVRCGGGPVRTVRRESVSKARRRWPWSSPPTRRSSRPIRCRCPARLPAVADWEPLVRAVMADRQQRRAASVASRPGSTTRLAELAVAAAQRAGCPQVVLPAAASRTPC